MLNQCANEDVFFDIFMWNDAQMREVREGTYEDIKDASKGTEWERAEENWNCRAEQESGHGGRGGLNIPWHPSLFFHKNGELVSLQTFRSP